MNETGKEKVIFIYNSIKYFIPFFIQKNILTYSVLTEVPFILRFVRKVSFIVGLPKSIWYAGWKSQLSSSSKVVVFANAYLVNNAIDVIDLVNYIKSVNPEIRIIYWYWNPVARCVNPNDIPNDLCEKWTFDKIDSELYGIKYNSQFYMDNIKLPESAILYDIVFVGADKGRRTYINDIRDEMEKENIKTYFRIVDDVANSRNYKGPWPFVPYGEYIELISKSKAIFDYVQEGQHGLTLRTMESIFLKKKLITNDRSIKNYDFYHPNNIFIIELDEIQNLKHFLTIPYEPISESILAYYDINNWLKRFVA